MPNTSGITSPGPRHRAQPAMLKIEGIPALNSQTASWEPHRQYPPPGPTTSPWTNARTPITRAALRGSTSCWGTGHTRVRISVLYRFRASGRSERMLRLGQTRTLSPGLEFDRATLRKLRKLIASACVRCTVPKLCTRSPKPRRRRCRSCERLCQKYHAARTGASLSECVLQYLLVNSEFSACARGGTHGSRSPQAILRSLSPAASGRQAGSASTAALR